jgi:hypothetical protein
MYQSRRRDAGIALLGERLCAFPGSPGRNGQCQRTRDARRTTSLNDIDCTIDRRKRLINTGPTRDVSSTRDRSVLIRNRATEFKVMLPHFISVGVASPSLRRDGRTLHWQKNYCDSKETRSRASTLASLITRITPRVLSYKVALIQVACTSRLVQEAGSKCGAFVTRDRDGKHPCRRTMREEKERPFFSVICLSSSRVS